MTKDPPDIVFTYSLNRCFMYKAQTGTSIGRYFVISSSIFLSRYSSD